MSEKRVITIQDSVNPATIKTFTSRMISQPFIVKRIEAEFALGCNGLLELEFATDNDDSTPATKTAGIGDSIFRPYSNTIYLRGNNCVRTLELDFVPPTIPAWLKVKATNNDAGNAHSVNVIWTIELISKEEYRDLLQG